MKQILQSLRTGVTEVADVPCPAPAAGRILIRSSRTLISSGTERMLADFGRAGFIEKARQQPDKVRLVLDKVRTDGLMPTLDAVRGKLDQPLALGYCNVGRVLQVGAGVTNFNVGDRVVSNGKHAEIVSVPPNLCARIPDAVSDEDASFTVLGAIALQGIRLAQPTLGESFTVIGLGLIGLLTVQLLRAHGCRVLAVDFDRKRLALAAAYGAELVDLSTGADPVGAAERFSHGRGIDGVIITATTKSDAPVHEAAQMCRKRGRIVLVGVTGLRLARADFYEKELSFQVSCSYGPGRYDPAYEQKGLDYPIGFVRWTEQRNFEAVLDMIAEGKLNVAPLITHRFEIADAERAYALIVGDEPSLGVVLSYLEREDGPHSQLMARTVASPRHVARPAAALPNGTPTVGFIGAGSYATGVLIPAFAKAGARLATIACNEGVSGVHAARKFGFASVTTDVDALLGDPTIDTVVIATRHDTHAALAIKALDAGKNVFVEKPLALAHAEIEALQQAYARRLATGPAPRLMVGFNRRFAPHIVKIKRLLAGVGGPKAMVMTVNAGAIPAEHWTQDLDVGGGRLIGEACHFVDLLRHLADTPIVARSMRIMASARADTATLQFTFADGSIGVVNYFANGHKTLAKERLEVFASGRILQLDNFRKLTGYGWSGFSRMGSWRQDKGNNGCAAAFVKSIAEGTAAPIPFDQLIEVGNVMLDCARPGVNAAAATTEAIQPAGETA